MVRLFFLTVALFFFYGCGSDDSGVYELLYPEVNEEYSGGEATVFDVSGNAFGFQAPNVTGQEELDFFVGNSLFNKNWVTSPASTTARDGLGPLFNARACSGCHFKDGRGRPPKSDSDLSKGLLLRLSIGNHPITGPIPDPIYGDQLQDVSIPNVSTEGKFGVQYEYIEGKYPDGRIYKLRKPIYQFMNLTQGSIAATHTSPRIANQMIGLGLLEAISESDILKNSDEFDTDLDGISGKANYVFNVEKNKNTLGLFGWKANQPSVRQQVAGAFSGDLGITSSVFPEENIPPSHSNIEIPNGGDPELVESALKNVTLYSSTLAVPARRNYKDQEVLQGKALFNEVKCASCHTPKFVTGSTHPIRAMRKQTIRPYSDMLLHDMGDLLADNSPDFLANGKEWRTQPLWGIGLIQRVNGHQFLLHDGRARGVEEAILWHGGEAENSKNQFMKLSKEDRDKLIKFINSL